jgi:hypothetical protein
MAKKKVTKSKTGKSNFGPEFAKKAYEVKLSERVPYDPEWDGKPMRQKETWDNTKVKKIKPTKPGQTVIGHLARGAKAGGLPGLALGAIAAYKAGLKEDSEAKKKKNRTF